LNSATETPATHARPPTWPHNFWTIDGTPPDTTNRASFGQLIGDCGVFMDIPSASRNWRTPDGELRVFPNPRAGEADCQDPSESDLDHRPPVGRRL